MTETTHAPASTSDMVREFHTTFQVPTAPGAKPVARFERLELRYSLVAEEFAELTEAVYGAEAGAQVRAATARVVAEGDDTGADVVEILDALADLVVVEHGWAIEAHLPLEEALVEVHRTNMAKLGPDGLPILRAGDNKILKPAGWTPPDLAGVIARA
ncbi:phosphoribosyl-ATP diphosphatase [Oerskovia sp. NPDC060338]|uniref:phosphoribosyl-ATP diphosphatase n=1 Tax=Oerskovia sp. NPDC060338 TaxID=3347100 RepID=UPI003649C8C6